MKNKKYLILIFLLSIALLLPLTAAASIFNSGKMSYAAMAIAKEMDKQLKAHYLDHELKKQDISIISTVAVDINDLKKTNALARQMSEEISTAFAKMGYPLLEIRKAKDIVMIEKEGEFVLTRDLSELASTNALGIAVLTGTYLITREDMRYSMTLLHLPSNKVLAKASAKVDLDEEMQMMVTEKPSSLRPNVQTKLDNY